MIKRFTEKTQNLVEYARGRRLVGLAAEIAFYEALAIFPFLMFCLALIGLLPKEGLVQAGLSMLDEIGPPSAVSLISSWVELVRRGASVPLMSLGAIAGLWIGSNGVGAFQRAFANVDPNKHRQPVWKQVGQQVYLTLLGAFLLIAVLVFWVVWPAVLAWVLQMVGATKTVPTMLGLVRTPLVFLLVVGGLLLFYQALAPHPGGWRAHLPGSVLATSFFWTFSYGFSYYIRHLSLFETIYGSLAAVMILLIWLQALNLSILLGEGWNAQEEKMVKVSTIPGVKS